MCGVCVRCVRGVSVRCVSECVCVVRCGVSVFRELCVWCLGVWCGVFRIVCVVCFGVC